MDISLEKPFDKSIEIEAISSKSFVHRLMIAAAIDGTKRKIVTNIFSEDMKATMNCLNALGADIRIAEDGFYIFSGVGNCDSVVLDCNESGSTARFMMPLAAVFSSRAKLIGRGKLPERPNGALCSELRRHGVEVDSDYIPTNISGKLQSGEYTIPGNISSQFITGLLIALPLIEGDSILNIEGKLESAGYVDVTLEVLGRFGIRIERSEKGFVIPGGQHYCAKDEEDIFAEGDWSNSAYILGMGAVGADVMVSGLNIDSTQPDRACIDLFKRFGARVEVSADTKGDTDRLSRVRVTKDTLHGISADVSQVPDLVPALAVVASFADSDSVFLNVQRLRIKESDRVESIRSLLKSYGIECETAKEGECEKLIVHGSGEPKYITNGWQVDSYNDHRIVMAAAMAFVGRNNLPLTIHGAEAINKSFPDFFKKTELI